MSHQKSPPFIETFDVIPHPSQENQAIVKLRGNWPTPSWEHVVTDIKIEGNTVRISYLGRTRGGIAMQVLQPFEEEIELIFPHAGEWRVIVEGRGQSTNETTVII